MAPFSSWPSDFIVSWEKSNKSTIWAEDSEDPFLAAQLCFLLTLPHTALHSGHLCKAKGMGKDGMLGRMGTGFCSVLLHKQKIKPRLVLSG